MCFGFSGGDLITLYSEVGSATNSSKFNRIFASVLDFGVENYQGVRIVFVFELVLVAREQFLRNEILQSETLPVFS
jgi:hypothetical protein